MANALKCDRCGSYFDYSSNADNFIAFGHKDITVSRNLPVKDICPNCMELFMKWLKNPDNWKPEDSLVNMVETIKEEIKYKDPCKSCYNGKCEQCDYGYCSEEEKKRRWLENHKKEV